MNTFDRHLLREWLGILLLVLAATCGLLLVQVLYDDFREIRELGGRGAILWTYVGVTIPGFLAVVLPLALLVSLLYTLGKLHRANEITAMRAAGVGFARMTAPIWVVGIACCGLSWWLNTNLVPWSIERSRAIKEELEFRREASRGKREDLIGAVYDVGFDNRQGRRMWFFNRYSKHTGRAYGVSVDELDAQRRQARRILAAEAWFNPARRGWEFKDGRMLTFDPDNGVLSSSKPFAEWFGEGFLEDPNIILLTGRKPSELVRSELRELIEYLKVEGNPSVVRYEVRYFGLMANTLGPLIVIAIAIPFAVSGVRTNPAVGVSKSIGLYAMYYLLETLGTALARNGVIEPIIAAWVPHAGMAAVAVWLFARLR